MRFGLATYAEQRRMGRLGDFFTDAENAAGKVASTVGQATKVIGDVTGSASGSSAPPLVHKDASQNPADSGGGGIGSGSTILLGGLGLAGALLWWKRRK